MAGQEERCRAATAEDASPRGAPLQPRVDVRPVLHELLDELEAAQVPGADRGRVAALLVAPIRLADPGQRVECREARSLVVRVGPRLQQGDGQLEVSVLDGQDQRRGPPGRGSARRPLGLHGLVDVGPGLQQDADDVRPALAHGEEQGREPGGQRGAELGPRLEEHLDDLRMPFGRRPHQGRLPAPFLGVDVGPSGEQRLHRPELPGARGGHQDRLVAAELGVRVGAGVEQQLDDRLIAVGAGQRKGRHAVAVRGLDVGLGVHQELRRLQVVVIGRPVQGRHAVGLGLVHVDVTLDKGADARPILLLRRVRQRGVGGRRFRSRGQENESQPAGAPTESDPSRSSPGRQCSASG